MEVSQFCIDDDVEGKSYMEDALRNDIEERDRIISTLNTKVKIIHIYIY